MTLFQVTDLKQFDYCPRLIFYHYCLPDIRPVTGKMALGRMAQRSEEVRAARRSLRVYGLQHGESQTNLYLESEALSLRGIVDLLITTNDNPKQQWEVVPVDYKLSTRKPGPHFKLQLLAYGMLAAEQFELPALRGFIYAIPKRRATEIKFSHQLRARLERSLARMRTVVNREQMPPPTSQRAKCLTCEFRRFCNDV